MPDMDVMSCGHLAVPLAVMQHVVDVESAFNPYAIGIVGAHLARQPRNRAEAVSTARMLAGRGYNFSVGLAQVNRYNLATYDLMPFERSFDRCANLRAGSRILAECFARSGGDWGKAFSCYYSGNFVEGYRAGYVQKVFASMRKASMRVPPPAPAAAIPLIVGSSPRRGLHQTPAVDRPLLERRMADSVELKQTKAQAKEGDAAIENPEQLDVVAGTGATSMRPGRADAAFVF